MSREWIQLRIRIPAELHAEVEAAATASGSSVQRELLMRIKKGSRPEPVAPSHARGMIAGELDVCEKLVESLRSVIHQMKTVTVTRDEPGAESADEG